MRIRYIRIAGLTLGGLVIAGVALVHTPPAKRFALAKLQKALAAQGVRLEASSLDFNLLTLQASMQGIIVQPEPGLPPLAKIDSLTVKLSLWDLLRGKFVVTGARLQHPEVWLIIMENGLTNLPKSKDDSPSSETFDYLVERLSATTGSLHVDDRRRGYKIVLPKWDLEVAGDRLANRHRIQLVTESGGSAAVEDKVFPIEFLGTVIDAGSKDLRIEALTLRSPGASATGTLSILDFQELGLNGKLTIDAQPGKFLPEVSGQVHAEVAIAGTAKAPLVTARLQAENASYQSYRNIGINGNFAYDAPSEAVTATDLALTSPFAALNGNGRLSLVATGPSAFQGTVQRALVGNFVPGLASSASGTFQAQWKGLDVAGARGTAAIRLAATRAPAKGFYPVTGNFRASRTALGTSIDIQRASLSGIETSGTIRLDPRNQLSGQLSVSTANIAAQPYAALPMSGAAKAQLNLRGTAQHPAADFTIDAPNLTAESVTGIAVAATGKADANRVDLHQSTIKWGGQSIAATGFVGLSGPSAPLAINAEVTNASVKDLGKLLGKTDIPVSGALNLRASITGTIDRPSGDASLDVKDVEAYSEKLGHLTASARFDRISATMPDLLLVKGPGERLQGKGTYEFQSKRFTASVKSDALKLTRGTVAINAEGSGTIEQPVALANLTGELNEVGPLKLKADLNGNALNVTAEAEKQNAKAEGRVTTVAPYPFTVQIQARETDLASLPVAVPKNLQGKVTATINASGEAANWRQSEVNFAADQLALVLDGQPVSTEGPLSATVRNGALDLKPVKLVGPGTRLTAGGQVPGTLRIDGTVNIAAAQKAFGQEGAAGELTLSGVVQSTLQAGRYSLDPRLDLALANGSYANPSINAVTAANLKAHLADGNLQIDSLDARWASAAISGRGEFPLALLSTTLPFDIVRKSGPANAELTVKGLNFAQLKGVPENVGGQASFTAKLESTKAELDAIRGEVRFDELRLQADKFNLAQETPSVLRLNGGTLEVEQFRLAGPASKVTLAGTAQLTGPQALQLRLDSNLDLGLLSAFTKTVRAQGATAVALNIGGAIPVPDASGFLQVTDANASITSPRVQAEKVNLRLDLAKNRVTLSALSGALNGGTLQGSGGFSLRGTEIEAADLRLTSNGVYLDFPANLKTMSNANIFLRSTGNRFLLGGNVAVIDGSYTAPVNLDQGVLNALNSSSVPEVREDRSPFLERLDFGIAIKTENPVVVDNNLAKAELDVDARLTGSYYRPGLVGRVTIDEGGSLNLNERKYLVDRGVLTFTDENKIDPSFDIVAKTQASGYDVTLSVQGSGKERETTLTSDPPLPEPDIAAVLLTGRTLDELSGQEADVAKEQVLSYLTGRVGGTLGRGIEQATGISQVRIEPNLIANESDPSARLTVGQNFTRQLSLIYSMNLTDSGDQILVGQYDISKRFRTRALKQSDNTYRFDFSRKQEFGGTAPPPTTTAERERKKIGVVQFSGDRPFTDEQLRKWLSARQGKTYDFFKIRRGVERITEKHANDGHLEARVRLTRTNRDSQVDLDLNIEAGPKVDFVYEGFRPDGGTQKKIREHWLSGVFDAQRADDAAATLRDDLVAQGYFTARIDHKIDTPEPSRKRVVFDIQPGDKFNAPKLVFAGAKKVDESDLRKLLRDRKLTLVAVTDPEEAIDALLRYYRDLGFLDIKVAKPELVLDAPAKSAMFIYPVNEGPLYQVGALKFAGNKVLKPEELLPTVTLETGSDYLPELREESLTNLREQYSRRGYNDAELSYALDRRPADGKVDVTFQITEGPQSVVESVTVSGNDQTSAGMIRSQLELKPGDPLDTQVLSHSRRNLYSTGAYSLIDIQRNALEPAAGKKAVSLDLNVREVRPFQVTYGGYFDTERGPGGIVDFTNRNSLGSARVIGVRARYDADLQESRLYFTQPLLKRFPLRTTASTFVRREVREGFNTDRLGFSVLQESRFGKAWILNYGYRLERTRTYDIGPDPIFDATLRVAPLTASLSRDTRDDLLDATRGSFFSNAVEYAPKFSGSELNFAKYFAQYFRYFAFDKPQLLPLQNGVRKSRLVFATGVRVGIAGGLNGQDLIPGRSSTNRVSLGERFFAGGGTTIRGFAQDGVGPRIFDGVSPSGGNALFILNNEMRFPIASIFDGVAFIDAGNVYDHLSDFRPSSVRKAGGLGIRVRTPYFLIRFDYGIKLDRRPGEPLGRPFFSIGQAF